MSRHVAGRVARRRRAALARLAAASACSALLAAPAVAHAASAGRAYEMVTPPGKFNGGAVLGQRAAADGDAVALIMTAATGPDANAYAIAPYVAHRTPSGWVTRGGAPQVHAEWRGPSVVKTTMVAFNDDLTSVLLRTNDPIDPGDREVAASGEGPDAGYDIYRYDVLTGAAAWLSPPAPAFAEEYGAGPHTSSSAFWGASRDGRRIVFASSRRHTADAPAGGVKLYERVDDVIRLASVLPGDPETPTTIASPIAPTQTQRGVDQVSDDGRRIIWRTGASPQALYLREDGRTTLPISASRAAANPGALAAANFLAASRDGAVVYFHSTTGRLTDDATGGGYYRWDRDGDRMTRIVGSLSSPLLGRASDDGSRLYFVATARLTPDAGTGRNIYLWEEGEQLRLVATTSGITLPPEDPIVVITPDGRYAYFTSDNAHAPGVASGVTAIYRYDAETDEIRCVSCRADGGIVTRRSTFRPAQVKYARTIAARLQQPRQLTDDGRLLFQSEEALVPHDVNGEVDVYEFDGTGVSLVSSGKGEGSEYVDNSADGRSVFFITTESLLPQDTDGGFPDIYVAREGGGFPAPPAAPPVCSGDTCQGPLRTPPAFDTPASAGVTPDAGADDAPPRAVTFRLLRPGRAQLRRFGRRGRIVLAVRVSAAGSVGAVARGAIGRRTRQLGQGWTRAGRRGTVRVAIRLNQAALRRLATGRPLRVTVVVRHSEVEEPRRLTLRLRRTARSSRGAHAAKAVKR